MKKRHTDNVKKTHEETRYTVDQAMEILQSFAAPKFDESVDVAVRLGVDSKKSDQMIRGSIALPHGLGKKIRVVVFAKGEKAKEAESAGADAVGAEDLVAKIEKGWLDFDSAIATPDMMGMVSKVGKILGPRGLMPNPKLGTVTMEVGRAVREVQAGKVEFRLDKAGIVHAPIGRRSFGKEKLTDNLKTLIDAIVRAKPASAKGQYLRSITVSATMSPGVHLDPASFI